MQCVDPVYNKWLLQLGNGELSCNEQLGENTIEIPQDMLSSNSIVTDIFGENLTIDIDDDESIKLAASHAILCPKNNDVDMLNSEVMDRMPGDYVTYLSDDSVDTDGDDDIEHYTVEFLNSITPSGMPSHQLKLKVGAIIMLLRNLNTRDGLCNGTRLIVVQLLPHLIQAKVITGSVEGNVVFIPRIDLCPSDTRYPFRLRRRQFPVKPAFAMTINKSQGQTLKKVGICLHEPVFAHGQLYVAFSRCKEQVNVKVQVFDSLPFQGNLLLNSDCVFTQNIVYKNIL